MHILFYISRFGIGGIQTFVIQMAKELIKKEGVKVSIFCHYPELIDNSQNEAIPSEIEIFALSKNQGKIVWINRIRNILKIFGGFDFKEWFTRRYFLKLVKTKGVNIIHNNIQTGDYNVFLAQQKWGIPYVTTLHGAYKHLMRDKISIQQVEAHKIIFQRLLDTCYSIVYLSDKNLAPFQKVLPELKLKEAKQFIRIFNGQEDYSGKVSVISSYKTALIFGMVARGHKDKGWIDLLHVFNQILNEGNGNIELHLFADGTYVQGLMNSNNWHPNIKYFGATTTPLKEILKFDIGLLPSYHEEMPFTIIEYLACGKPIIATEVGAIPEMIRTQNGELAGKLVPVNNFKVSQVALKEVILEFIEHPALVETYATNSNKAFEKFNIQNTVNQYYDLYQKAINK